MATRELPSPSSKVLEEGRGELITRSPEQSQVGWPHRGHTVECRLRKASPRRLHVYGPSACFAFASCAALHSVASSPLHPITATISRVSHHLLTPILTADGSTHTITSSLYLPSCHILSLFLPSTTNPTFS